MSQAHRQIHIEFWLEAAIRRIIRFSLLDLENSCTLEKLVHTFICLRNGNITITEVDKVDIG